MQRSLIRVLAIKPFAYLFLAEVLSQISMNMTNFILIILAYDITNSNTAVSGIVLSYTIPAIVFGIIAGAVVDRFSKRSILFVTNIVRAILLIPLFFLHANIGVLYLISLLFAIATQFFIPAETPMIPLLVKKKHLIASNALFGMGVYGSALLAYALSGPILLFFGSANIFLFLSILLLIAAFFVWLIRVPLPKKVEDRVPMDNISFAQELRQFFSLVAKTKHIYHALLLLSLSQVLILILAVVGPGFARDILNIAVLEFPIYFVTPAVCGMIVGAILVERFFHSASRHATATIGVFLSGIAVLLLPKAPIMGSYTIHAVAFLAIVLGIANSFIFVPSNVILQEETSDSFRGKVYGFLNSLTGVLSLAPIVIAGGLADIFGVAAVLISIGLLLIMLGIIRFVL